MILPDIIVMDIEAFQVTESILMQATGLGLLRSVLNGPTFKN